MAILPWMIFVSVLTRMHGNQPANLTHCFVLYHYSFFYQRTPAPIFHFTMENVKHSTALSDQTPNHQVKWSRPTMVSWSLIDIGASTQTPPSAIKHPRFSSGPNKFSYEHPYIVEKIDCNVGLFGCLVKMWFFIVKRSWFKDNNCYTKLEPTNWHTMFWLRFCA